MSESDRSSNYTTKIVGLFAALIASIIAIGVLSYSYHLGSLSTIKVIVTEHNQAEYSDYTASRIENCHSNTDPLLLRECIEESIADNYENQRYERDLQAQSEMADWAFLLLVVSSFSLFITAIGTSFLFWQITLTRKAVEDTGEATKAMLEANNIALNAQRAWVFVKDIKILQHPEGSIIQIIFHNYGEWPAMKFCKSAVIENEPYPFWATPIEKPNYDSASFIPPRQEEVFEMEKFILKDREGMKHRLSLSWQYETPTGTHLENQDWVIDCVNSIWDKRKMVPTDSINYKKN